MKVVIPDRICPHCGGNKWIEIIRNRVNGEKYYVYTCALKESIRKKQYRTTSKYKESNRKRALVYYYKDVEKSRDRSKKYRKSHVKEKYEYLKKYREVNKEKILEHNRKMSKKRVKDMQEDYVRGLISLCILKTIGMCIDKSIITQEQIQMYRQSLSVQRKLKQLKNENR